MTVDRYNRKLDANTARMLRNEDRAALKMFRILEDSRTELIGKLSRHTERGNGYSMAFYQAMLADVEATLNEMYARASAMMKEEMTSAFTLGQEHMGAEVAVFETGIGVITPKVNTAILDIIINERTEFVQRLTESVKRTMMNEIRREAATRAANQNAVSGGIATQVIEDQLLANQIEGIKGALAKGFVQGDSVPQIVKRLTHPTEGTFMKMAKPSAVRTVRIGMNDTYNEGRNEQLRSVHERLPHIKRAWRSALQDSTPICLHLHGQKCAVGEPFKHGGWNGERPPAIGNGASPAFHLCRSCVVAYSERWPVNPLLEPLSPERIAHFKNGGKFQQRDIVRPQQGPKPKPQAPLTKPTATKAAPVHPASAPKPAKVSKPTGARPLIDLSELDSEDATVALKKVFKMPELTRRQRSSIMDYKDDYFEDVNNNLRGGDFTKAYKKRYGKTKLTPYERAEHKKELKSIIEELDQVFRKAKLPEDMMLFRGVNDRAVVEALDKAHATGTPMVDKGFISTSASKGEARTFAKKGKSDITGPPQRAVIEIKAKKGTPAINMEGVLNGEDYEEAEVLLKRGQKLKIVGREERGGIVYYQAET